MLTRLSEMNMWFKDKARYTCEQEIYSKEFLEYMSVYLIIKIDFIWIYWIYLF